MTNGTGNVISRSVVRSKCENSPNLSVECDQNVDDDVENFEFIGGKDCTIESMTTDTDILPTVYPNSLIEDAFLVCLKNEPPNNESNYEGCENMM